MDAIGPGDLIECVNAAPGDPVHVGGIYLCTGIGPGFHPPMWSRLIAWIRGLRICDKHWDAACLDLAEVPYDPDYGFCAGCFRPISRRSDFEAFLNTVKAPRDDVSAPGKRVPERA